MKSNKLRKVSTIIGVDFLGVLNMGFCFISFFHFDVTKPGIMAMFLIMQIFNFLVQFSNSVDEFELLFKHKFLIIIPEPFHLIKMHSFIKNIF